MLLFPDDIQALQAALENQLALDPELAAECRPLIEQQAYPELLQAAVGVLARRLALKSGLAAGELPQSDWPTRISWEAAGLDPADVQVLVLTCRAALEGGALSPSPKTARALLLLVDTLLEALSPLPDLGPPEVAPDVRPFFHELVKHLNALLPYEQRDFPVRETPNGVELLLSGLPENAYYGVVIRPPAGGAPGQIEMGLHLSAGEGDRLLRHFERKLPALSRSMGEKEIVLREEGDDLCVLLTQPYRPDEKLSGFMTAATLVGLIGSLQERMPRWSRGD